MKLSVNLFRNNKALSEAPLEVAGSTEAVPDLVKKNGAGGVAAAEEGVIFRWVKSGAIAPFLRQRRLAISKNKFRAAAWNVQECTTSSSQG